MQKILIEITTVNDAKPDKVAEIISQMTGRQCKVIHKMTNEQADSILLWLWEQQHLMMPMSELEEIRDEFIEKQHDTGAEKL